MKRNLFLVFAASCSNKKQEVVNATAPQIEKCMEDSVYEQTEFDEQGREQISLSSFGKYQTFDEFKMKPVGKPKRIPFVYVRMKRDFIWVVPSYAKDSIYVYVKKNDRWINESHFDMWNVDEDYYKSYQGNFARVYYRICGNDSVIEYKRAYIGGHCYRSLFIKTPLRCWLIELLEKDKFSQKYIFEGVINLVGRFTHDRMAFLEEKEGYDKRSFELFAIKKRRKWYLYQNANKLDEKLYFHKNSLGLWGIQPGLDKYDSSLSTNKYYH